MNNGKTSCRGVFLLTAGATLLSLSISMPLAHAGSPSVGTLASIAPSDAFALCNTDDVSGQEASGSVNYPDSQIEPWIDVNPTNADNMVAGWQQDRWDDGGSRGLVSAYTIDGGSTWTQVPIPNIVLCTGGTYHRATDPWLSFAPNGDLYFFSLALDLLTTAPNRAAGFGPNALFVSKSIDGGKTWSDTKTIIAVTNPRVLNDKNSITADPGDKHYVYAVWDQLTIPTGQAIAPEDVSPAAGKAVALGLLAGVGYRGPTFFSRTTDSGATWETAHSIYDPGANNQTIGNQIVVLPDNAGTVIDFFDEILSFKTNNSQGVHSTFNLSLIRSFDKGATWQIKPTPIRAQQILCNGAKIPNPSVSDRVVRDACILFDVAVDRTGLGTNGNLYAVWQDNRFNGIDQVAFSQSTNGGMTWSTPIKVNQTPDNSNNLLEQAFLPSVAVNDDGTVVVTYYDFRNDDTSTLIASTDYFVVTCDPTNNCSNASSWTGNEAKLTDSSFNLAQAPVAPASRGHFLGDYMGLAADTAGKLWPAFGQTTGSNHTAIYTRGITP
jgi:hypothetical protein